MLEKSSKKEYFDAHFHLFYSQYSENLSFFEKISGCSCAHSIKEWNFQYQYKLETNNNLKLAFGLHPQSFSDETNEFNPEKMFSFLCTLASEKKIDAIGETGFDLFTKDFKLKESIQEEYFVKQIELAIENNLPVIIHCRKANNKLFEYSGKLKKLPSVLFHSFMGSPVEAMSFLERGINGYFSFGKQMLNNNKKVIKCVQEIPAGRLMCETDAPFQFLKDEKQTYLYEIEKVYKTMWELKKDEGLDFETFMEKVSGEKLFL